MNLESFSSRNPASKKEEIGLLWRRKQSYNQQYENKNTSYDPDFDVEFLFTGRIASDLSQVGPEGPRPDE